ncbi:MAG: PEP-CTERM sorting domain-containing protein [Opitutaceae bacterium]|jgi:hypothetical protein|nr:PEP-CTERM sorting domain-containing protein [Opitutaceae bacterium]
MKYARITHIIPLVLFAIAMLFASRPGFAATIDGTRESAFYTWNAQAAPNSGTGAWDSDSWLGAGQAIRSGNAEIQRAIVSFSLENLPTGQEVASATLTFQIHSNSSGREGNLALYHSQTADPVMGKTYWEDSSFSNQVTSSAATPSSGFWADITIDVTDWIKLDYANDPSGSIVSSFRFQVDKAIGDYSDTTAAHRYCIAKSSIKLSIVTQDAPVSPPVPEPATFAALAAIGVFAFAAWHRRH